MNILRTKIFMTNQQGIFSMASSLAKNKGAFAKVTSFKKQLPKEEKKEIAAMIPEKLAEAKTGKKSAKDPKIMAILRKIARGEQLTPDEMETLKEIDPESLTKAKMAAQRRKEIESRLRTAKTKEEFDSILTSAKQEAHISLSGKTTQEYGDYLAAAVRKIEEKFRNGEEKTRKKLDIKI